MMSYNYALVIKAVGNRLISLVGRVFVNGPGDLGSISGHIISKTLKMVYLLA